MIRNIFIGFVLIFCLFYCSIFAVHSKTSVYADPPTQNGVSAIIAFGAVTASFAEALDCSDDVVYDRLVVMNTLDEDCTLRIGTTGGLEIPASLKTNYALDKLDLPGKIYIKYDSSAPTLGKIKLLCW